MNDSEKIRRCISVHSCHHRTGNHDDFDNTVPFCIFYLKNLPHSKYNYNKTQNLKSSINSITLWRAKIFSQTKSNQLSPLISRNLLTNKCNQLSHSISLYAFLIKHSSCSNLDPLAQELDNGLQAWEVN